MLRIKHKKGECIGCGLCAETAPQYFEMDEDGMAQLIGGCKKGVFFEVEGFEDDLDELEQSEEGCPVDIIHVEGQ